MTMESGYQTKGRRNCCGTYFASRSRRNQASPQSVFPLGHSASYSLFIVYRQRTVKGNKNLLAHVVCGLFPGYVSVIPTAFSGTIIVGAGETNVRLALAPV
jgi:hypothetical protein